MAQATMYTARPELGSRSRFATGCYARYGRDCDVYVYADTQGGYTCERCPRVGESFRCLTAAQMADHLVREHRAKGHRVPDDAIEELRAEKEER